MTFVAHPDGTVEDYDSAFPSADTGFGPQIDAQAWAAGDPSVEPQPYREHHSWATVLKRAALSVGVGAAIAATVLMTLGASSDSNASSMVSSQSTIPVGNDTVIPTTPDPPPFVMPPNIPVGHETQDGDYLQRLRAAGITYSDPDAAVGAGKWVCDKLNGGTQVPGVIGTLLAKNPALTEDKANKFVSVATTVYCPGE